jgi:F-type H+-transporting ATPase subunit epsilon
MKVRVYTLQEILFEGDAKEVIAKTTTGEISVLENHIPLVTTLVAAPLKVVKENGERMEVEVKKGFLEVRPNNSVVILVDELQVE